MYFFIAVSIILTIWVLIKLHGYTRLLMQIEKRLSPEEQKSLKESNEKLQKSLNLLKENQNEINKELNTSSKKNVYLENTLEDSQNKSIKSQEKIECLILEKESIQIDLDSCRKIIKNNEILVKEQDFYISELLLESSAKAEAVKFAVKKLNQHIPNIKDKPKIPNTDGFIWSGNSNSKESYDGHCHSCGRTPCLCSK